MSFADSHCHLSDPRFAGELPQVLQRARAMGIDLFVMAGTSPEDWQRQKEVQKIAAPARVLTCFGLHPWFVAGQPEAASTAWKKLEQLVASADQRPCALGETGLDFHPRWPESTHALQRELFLRHLALHKTSKLPLILHVVRAHGPALEILEAHGNVRGMVHSFAGSREVLRRYLKLGLHISVSGGLLRSKPAHGLQMVADVPADRLLLESDSPDQAPPDFKPFIEELNEPTSIFQVAEAIAATQKAQTAQKILEQSRLNLLKLFSI